MEKDNKELEENFLSRWSKKKSKQKSEIENSKYEQLDQESSEETEDSSSLVEENDKLNDDELLKKYNLPNPEKIKREKSLDVFFKEGVPDRLRQIALRRVWRLNPIIRFADAEINDYHEDFTDAATVIEGMETAYKVGKGYVTELIDDNDENSIEESLLSEEISTEKNKKKKVKKTSKKINTEEIKNDESKQISNKVNNKVNKEDTQYDKKITEPVILKEEPTNKSIENQVSVKHIERKPKPQNMVFKPKKDDT